MAVTFDARFEKGVAGQTSPFSFLSSAGDETGSVGANSDRILIGVLSTQGNHTAAAMTWGGVSMTQIGTTVTIGLCTSMFGLIAPATGAQTLSASWSGGSRDTCLGAISVYDADQSTGWQNNGTNTATSVSPSGTVTTAADNMVIAFVSDDNSSSATITSGTEAWQERALNGNHLAGYKPSTGSSETISWTLGTSVAWLLFKVDVIAAVPLPPITDAPEVLRTVHSGIRFR